MAFRQVSGPSLILKSLLNWWLGELCALVPAPLRRSLEGRTGPGNLTGWVAAAVLLILALVAPVLRYEWAVAVGRVEMERLRPAADQALILRRQIDGSQGVASEVLAAKAAAPSAVRLLDDLSQRLPDDTWIAQFKLLAGRLDIHGTAASAAALVPLIEASPLFGSVTFRAPIVRDPLTGKEQFQMSIALAVRP